jgi:hypothetical protein
MRTIVKTPSGLDIVITVGDDLIARVTVKNTDYIDCVSDLYCGSKLDAGKYGKCNYLTVTKGDTRYPIALASADDKAMVDKLHRALGEMRAERKVAKIPGYAELKAAYSERGYEIDKESKALEESYETSIYRGDSGIKTQRAEEKVKQLEQQYPIAKKYIEYINYASRTAGLDSGYQAKLAATALEEGKTLEEAEKIAHNWDKWI